MAHGLPGTVSGMWQVGAGSWGDRPMSLAVGCLCPPCALTQLSAALTMFPPVARDSHGVVTPGACPGDSSDSWKGAGHGITLAATSAPRAWAVVASGGATHAALLTVGHPLCLPTSTPSPQFGTPRCSGPGWDIRTAVGTSDVLVPAGLVTQWEGGGGSAPSLLPQDARTHRKPSQCLSIPAVPGPFAALCSPSSSSSSPVPYLWGWQSPEAAWPLPEPGRAIKALGPGGG